jgi:NAD(P)-dependent dehydrogenase (short-subunit alcohol dehydrogenase family)
MGTPLHLDEAHCQPKILAPKYLKHLMHRRGAVSFPRPSSGSGMIPPSLLCYDGEASFRPPSVKDKTMDFKGKVALVTGGSSGIGRATALLFAREGAKVVIAARSPERSQEVVGEIEARGGEAIFVPTDVAAPSQVERSVAAAIERFGRLDCAVNNAAGRMGAFSATADFSEAEFDETIAVDLKGVWVGMKHEIAQMLRQTPGGGAIVNVSSVNGLGGAPMGALYSAAKAGILALTKSAAHEYGRRGIRVNALAAGAFDTPMLNSSIERISGGAPEAREKTEGLYKSMIGLGRFGRPEEAAEAIVWLCSDAAAYVTGHSMIVDGGLTAPFR